MLVMLFSTVLCTAAVFLQQGDTGVGGVCEAGLLHTEPCRCAELALTSLLVLLYLQNTEQTKHFCKKWHDS